MTPAERYRILTALTKRPVLDESYYAAFYLISFDDDLFKKTCHYVSVDGVDFTAIKRVCNNLEHSQKQLLSIAHNLFSWSSKCAVTPHDLACLGYPMLDQVCSALYIANGTVRVQVEENENGQPEYKLDMSKYEQNKKIYDKLFSPASWPQDVEAQGFEPE